MRKYLDLIVKYWVIIAACSAVLSFTATTMHSHASEHAQQQVTYNLKADKERSLLRTEWEIERIKKEKQRLGAAFERQSDLDFMIAEKVYIQKVLRGLKQ